MGSKLIRFGDVEIDLDLRIVTRSGKSIRLTPLEYHLLTQFARYTNRFFAHGDLLHLILGGMHDRDKHYLGVPMRNLRKKLEADLQVPNTC